jgi:hypothetical protein
MKCRAKSAKIKTEEVAAKPLQSFTLLALNYTCSFISKYRCVGSFSLFAKNLHMSANLGNIGRLFNQ